MRLYKILKKPIFTEKASSMELLRNWYVFQIADDATKIDVKKAISEIYWVEVSSVKKKMKDKAFARAVNREDIIKGAQEINIPLEEHIQFCIDAMKQNKELLGLWKSWWSEEFRFLINSIIWFCCFRAVFNWSKKNATDIKTWLFGK